MSLPTHQRPSLGVIEVMSDLYITLPILYERTNPPLGTQYGAPIQGHEPEVL